MIRHFISSRLQPTSLLRVTLLNMALLDELITGFVVVGLPLLRDQLGLSYEQVGLLFSVGGLSALIFEPVVNLLSDRSSKRWWILGGLLGLALGFALAGGIGNFIVLLVAFALIYPATGAAVGLSQAALIDSTPDDGARMMTRWTLVSSIGDLLSPLVVAAFVPLGLGWSALCWFGAVAWLTAGVLVWCQRFPRPTTASSDDAPSAELSVLVGLRKALRDPLLLRWAALATVPTMVDEVFIGFAALYLRDVLHASEVVISGIIVIQLIGAFLGLLIVDRLAGRTGGSGSTGRIAPSRLLIYSALLVLVGFIGLLNIHSLWFATLALFIIELGAAGWYPIAKAEAYARQPGRSGTVLTVMGLGTPFDMALPGIIGLVASRFGLLAGLGILGSAPLLILLLVPWRSS